MSYLKLIITLLAGILLLSCKEKREKQELNSTADTQTDSKRSLNIIIEKPDGIKTPEGMVWIPGGTFIQGAISSDKMAMNHEKPAHKVVVDGFFMDKTEVTNGEFKKFVDETGYVTVAERPIDWEEMKKQLPPGTPKPADSILQPGSLTFKKTKNSVPNFTIIHSGGTGPLVPAGNTLTVPAVL